MLLTSESRDEEEDDDDDHPLRKKSAQHPSDHDLSGYEDCEESFDRDCH